MKMLVAAALLGMSAAAPPSNDDLFLFDQDPLSKPVIEGTSLALATVMRPRLGEDRVFIETSTIRKTGDIADAWVLRIFYTRRKTEGGIEYDGLWSSVRFNCAAKTFERRAGSMMDADGKTHHRANLTTPPRPLESYNPDYYSEMYYYSADIACGTWDWKLGGHAFPSAATATAEVRLPVPEGYQSLPLPPPPPPAPPKG